METTIKEKILKYLYIYIFIFIFCLIFPIFIKTIITLHLLYFGWIFIYYNFYIFLYIIKQPYYFIKWIYNICYRSIMFIDKKLD
jgi:hypothetical protein